MRLPDRVTGLFLVGLGAAAAFVGKDVSYTDATGASVTGTASAVSFAGPVPVVTVGGVEIPLDLISGITAPSAH